VLAAVPMPDGAGVLTCRVLDPVNQPVSHAEFAVTDTAGRKVVGGGLDPFGSFTVTLPAGEYRLAVSAEGYAPHPGERHGGRERAGLARRSDAAGRPATALPRPGDWEIEPAHSSIGFTARHIGLAKVRGRFNTSRG
jgi:hypothetical protein